MTTTVESILTELQQKDAHAITLLDRYRPTFHPELEPLWREKPPRLFRAFGRALISQGHPAQALEVVCRALEKAASQTEPPWHPGDTELLYLGALALARGGNIIRAQAYAKELLANHDKDLGVHLRIEALSLLGRLDKDRYQRTPESNSARRTELARSAQAAYASAHKIAGDPYPGINAALMAALAGDPAEARRLAQLVKNRVITLPGWQQDYWHQATLGLACLLLGDPTGARGFYNRAVQLAGRKVGDIAAMRRDALLLRERNLIGEYALEWFPVGRVVVFAGHGIDHPDDDGLWRFPPQQQLEDVVREAIRMELQGLEATVGYCSPGCGSEILFAEVLRECGGELHLVLPFVADDFYRQRVDYGRSELAKWRHRCDELLRPRESVHYATTEDYLDDQELFDFTATFVQGLGITRARQLGGEPVALVVRDPSAGNSGRGLQTFIDKWKGQLRVIDLAEQRGKAGLTAPPEVSAVRPAAQRLHQRTVQAMLFADVKGFSKLRESKARAFFEVFLQRVHKVRLEFNAEQLLFANTWGDGLYLVFKDVVACARCALRLLETLGEVDWTAVGMPQDTAVRIGVHTGPVFKAHDPLIEKDNYFGSHVSRAARIEPVTTPGCAFASEQFAALLAMEGGNEFVCEYIGVQPLAKDYDRCPLYQLQWR
jgi:class 3 adenylate cyclase/tetratricopeptide (TPR) repeat protein